MNRSRKLVKLALENIKGGSSVENEENCPPAEDVYSFSDESFEIHIQSPIYISVPKTSKEVLKKKNSYTNEKVEFDIQREYLYQQNNTQSSINYIQKSDIPKLREVISNEHSNNNISQDVSDHLSSTSELHSSLDSKNESSHDSVRDPNYVPETSETSGNLSVDSTLSYGLSDENTSDNAFLFSGLLYETDSLTRPMLQIPQVSETFSFPRETNSPKELYTLKNVSPMNIGTSRAQFEDSVSGCDRTDTLKVNTKCMQQFPSTFSDSDETTHRALYTKKSKERSTICPFCYQDVNTHFTRHLLRHHKENKEVCLLRSMKPRSKERLALVASLRKQGYFYMKTEKDISRPVKTSGDPNTKYFVCTFCLGQYTKKWLYKHIKTCERKKDNTKTKNCLSASQTFMALVHAKNNDFLKMSRLKEEVFSIMRPDDISEATKNDPLICLYGELLLSKHKRQQIVNVVSNKIREMGRLLIVLRSNHNVRVPNIKWDNRQEKKSEIKDLKKLIDGHWCSELGSLALKNLKENQWNKPQELPLTSDIKLFQEYLDDLSKNSFSKLTSSSDILPNDYKDLTECVLAKTVLFNRKRIGDVQYLKIDTYAKQWSTNSQETFMESLTSVEKILCKKLKRIVTGGKGSKPVPILFPEQIQKYISCLLKIRQTTDIVPKCNPYIFANPGSEYKWMSGVNVMRKLAKNCGAVQPGLLTSTKFRKHIATTLQLMTMKEDEMEQLATFMGHTKKTHAEFYRLPQDIFQTAKVAKVLLLLEKGKGKEFRGKSLNEIELDGDVYFSSESEDEELNERSLAENILDKVRSDSKSIDGNESDYGNSTATKQLVESPQLGINEKTCQPSSQGSNGTKKKSEKTNRHKWTEEQKILVRNHFCLHIDKKIPAKKYECNEFLDSNRKVFPDVDWVKIKTFVFNSYRRTGISQTRKI